MEVNLVYKVSSRTVRDTQRNPVSKKQKPKNKQTNKKKQKTKNPCLGESLRTFPGKIMSSRL